MEQYPTSQEVNLITITLYPLSSRQPNGSRSVEQHGAEELMSTLYAFYSMCAIVALC